MRLPPSPTFDLPFGAWEVLETEQGFSIVDPVTGDKGLAASLASVVSEEDYTAITAALRTASSAAQWVSVSAGLAVVQILNGSHYLQLLPPGVAGGFVLDAIADPACIIDGQDRIIAVNRPWRFTDKAAETAVAGVGASYRAVLDRGMRDGVDGVERLDAALRRIRLGAISSAEGSDEVVAYHMAHPDGTVHNFLVRLRMWPAAGAGAVLVVHTDVTRVVSVAQAYDDHAALVRQAGDLAQIGGWILDIDQQTLAWTPAVCRMHGLPDDCTPTLADALAFYQSGRDRQRITELVERARATGEGWSVDLRITTAQGDVRWLRSIGEAEWRAGRVVRLRGAVQDVTAAKAQLQELEESHELLRVATRGAHIGLWEWDGVSLDSPAQSDASLCAVFGMDLPGPTTPRELLRAIHDDDRETVSRYITTLAVTHLPAAPLEVRFWRTDGRGGWLRLRAEWSPRPDGTPRLVGTAWDITVQRQADLRRENDRKQLALAAKSAKMALFELPLDRPDWLMGDTHLAHMIGLQEPVGWSWRSAVLERVADSDRGRLEQAVKDLRTDRTPLDVTVEMQPLREHGVRYLRFMAQFQPTGTDGAAHIVGLVHDVTDQRVSDERLAHLASHDQLTGLRNRFGLLEALQTLTKSPSQEGVLCMLVDIDGFTEINEAHGYAAGDQVLRHVAACLQGLTPAGGDWARIAGDEFVLVAPWRLIEGDTEDPLRFAAACKHAIEVHPMPHTDRETPLRLSVTIGLAVSAPGGATTAETLLQQADVAMAEARSRNETRIGLIEPPMATRHREEAVLLQDLRRALATTQSPFVVHYQPQLSLRTNRIIGVEALVRWNHPTRGMLSPDQFLPVADRHGLDGAVGQAVLQQACAEAAHWWARGHAVPVAVNLSPLQFDRTDIVSWVESALASSGLPAAALELELTESAFARQPEAVIERLRTLRASGVRIALDDFGTGYSSLALLNQLPIDRLKIDRAFIHHLSRRGRGDGRTISRLILSLARELELETVAEGVEQPDDLLWLREHGCDVVQGYLVSKPLARDHLETFFAQHCIQTQSEWAANQPVTHADGNFFA